MQKIFDLHLNGVSKNSYFCVIAECKLPRNINKWSFQCLNRFGKYIIIGYIFSATLSGVTKTCYFNISLFFILAILAASMGGDVGCSVRSTSLVDIFGFIEKL